LNTLLIDASVTLKWVVEEDGTDLALALRQKARLMAPDLMVAECANILWKKVQRKELSKDEALIAARLLQSAEFDVRERFRRMIILSSAGKGCRGVGGPPRKLLIASRRASNVDP
jgi:hypothetical protein